MEILKIEPMVEDSAWEIVKRNTFNCRPNSDQHRAWIVTYKLKGNKHHQMNVFAPNEVVAIAKAVEAYQTNQEVIALQKLTGRIK